MYSYQKLKPADRHAPHWGERLARERALTVAESMVAPSAESVIEVAAREAERFK